MIPMLEFRRDGQPRFRVRLSRAETRIGRDARCDVVLPEDHVSRVHFVVRRAGERFVVVDRSRNGTLLDGAAVAETVLGEGSVIGLPPWEIAFLSVNGTPLPETAVRDLLNPAPVVSTVHDGGAVVVQAGEMRVREGPAAGERYVIRKPEVRVGSDPTCDWVLTGDVAPHHFSITLDRGCYTLRDAGSPDGTRVDGRRVRGPVEIHMGTCVEVGSTRVELIDRTHEEPVRPMEGDRLGDLLGASHVMREMFQLIRRVASAEVPVLILGETGSGKELVAGAVHEHGSRAGGPLVAVNCGALPAELVESELFGHTRGAFTGATAARNGAFREAHGGTLFLDEIGDLAPAAQVRFLRVLETGTVRPVGADREVPVDVRVVAATHRNLPAEVERKQFREDLFFRLAVGMIRVPPLRARSEDIPMLVDHVLRSAIPDRQLVVGDSAMQQLKDHPWRGNVRALRNVLLRASLLVDGDVIEPGHLRFDLATPDGSEPLLMLDQAELDGSLERAERRAITHALESCNGNKMAAARVLGIAKSTLHVKLKKYGMG